MLSATSFPLPFVKNGEGGETLVAYVSKDELAGLLVEPDNCHAGIEGRGKLGNGGAGVDVPGVRLSNSVFNDLSSCWSSPNDCVCASLFFSII